MLRKRPELGQVEAKVSGLILVTAAGAVPAWAKTGGGTVSPRVEFVEAPPTLVNMPHEFSPWAMYVAAGGVVKAVIISLVLASILCWTIGLVKYLQFAKARRRLHAGLLALSKSSELAGVKALDCEAISDMVANAEDEMVASQEVLHPIDADGVKQRVALRLERVEAGFSRRISAGIGLLAIIGSTAPFVGLFGTVWGVMNSFIGISQSKTTNLAVVAPGIAEALLATAFGLFAAVPAVVIYNLFARLISAYRGELGDASAVVTCLAGRQIDRVAVEGAD